MQKFTIRGIVKHIGEVKEFASGFKKRSIVVETGSAEYANPVEMSLKKSHIDDSNGYQPEDRVEIDFTIDGRRWDSPNGTRYFTDITVWAIRPADGAKAQDMKERQEAKAKQDAAAMGATDPDDLPF